MARTPLIAAVVAAACGVTWLAASAAGATTSHWSNTQCSDYQATFLKLYASPSRKQVAAANGALGQHGCRQRVQRLPQAY